MNFQSDTLRLSEMNEEWLADKFHQWKIDNEAPGSSWLSSRRQLKVFLHMILLLSSGEYYRVAGFSPASVA